MIQPRSAASNGAPAHGSGHAADRHTDAQGVLRCIAFGPYADDLDPERDQPSSALMDTLLDIVVRELGFRCIMTYNVRPPLDHIFQAASQRGLKVIAIIWLDSDQSANNASIEGGIQAVRTYPNTIIRLSCGSELRTRRVPNAEAIIRDCTTHLRDAGVSQPTGYIDTWWVWCGERWPCQRWDLADDVDWIGINVFPWWENKYSGLFPCTPAADAAAFHVARYQDLMARYPEKEVILTEFGWPAGPAGYTETNQYTGQQCGVAGQENQCLVIEETLAELDRLNLPGVVFETLREPWKARNEGPVGPYWGICEENPPYTCRCLACPNFDGDERVDVDDIEAVAAHWRRQTTDPGWDTRFDLYRDGRIDVVDIMRVAAKWGEECP